MPTRSKSFWDRRAEENLIRQERKARSVLNEIVKENNAVLARIRKLSNSFFTEYGKEGKLEISDIEKGLTSSEMQEYKNLMREYLKKVKGLDRNSPFVNVMQRNIDRVRVTRVMALEHEVAAELQLQMLNEQVKLDKMFDEQYKEGFYRAGFTARQTAGFGTAPSRVTNKAVEKGTETKIQDKNWQQRLLTNVGVTALALSRLIPQNVARGFDARQFNAEVRSQIETNLNRTSALVRTETSRVHTEATIAGYKESGVVSRYRILATLDDRTTRICADMDGKEFDIDEAVIGVTHPPFHPNCRTTIMFFPTNKDLTGTRVGMDRRGEEVVDIPIDMKYDEYYLRFLAREGIMQ